MIDNYYDDDFFDRIEIDLHENERLRRAAFEMNLDGRDLPPGIDARLIAALGQDFVWE